MKHITRKAALIRGGLVLLAGLCMLGYARLAGRLPSQQQAQRWAGEGETAFVQLSAFLPPTGTITTEAVYTFRQTAVTALTEASIEDAGSLLCDAWSAQGSLKVTGDHGSSEARVIAVGGSFFDFHPLRLRSGCYLTQQDLMKDRVLLDEALAWQFFGSSDLVGMTVTINGGDYVVAGVVAREDDWATGQVSDDTPLLFMSYEAWSALDSSVGISCYEIVLPEPVEGYALSLMQNKFTLNGGVLRQNTGRFGPTAVGRLLRQFGTRSVREEAVAFPYWENAARYTEDWCALLLALTIALLLYPGVCLAVQLVQLALLGRRKLRAALPGMADRARDAWDDRRWRRQKGER